MGKKSVLKRKQNYSITRNDNSRTLIRDKWHIRRTIHDDPTKDKMDKPKNKKKDNKAKH